MFANCSCKPTALAEEFQKKLRDRDAAYHKLSEKYTNLYSVSAYEKVTLADNVKQIHDLQEENRILLEEKETLATKNQKQQQENDKQLDNLKKIIGEKTLSLLDKDNEIEKLKTVHLEEQSKLRESLTDQAMAINDWFQKETRSQLEVLTQQLLKANMTLELENQKNREFKEENEQLKQKLTDLEKINWDKTLELFNKDEELKIRKKEDTKLLEDFYETNKQIDKLKIKVDAVLEANKNLKLQRDDQKKRLDKLEDKFDKTKLMMKQIFDPDSTKVNQSQVEVEKVNLLAIDRQVQEPEVKEKSIQKGETTINRETSLTPRTSDEEIVRPVGGHFATYRTPRSSVKIKLRKQIFRNLSFSTEEADRMIDLIMNIIEVDHPAERGTGVFWGKISEELAKLTKHPRTVCVLKRHFRIHLLPTLLNRKELDTDQHRKIVAELYSLWPGTSKRARTEVGNSVEQNSHFTQASTSSANNSTILKLLNSKTKI